MKDIYILIISFFIYSFLGWIWESVILCLAKGSKPINRGFLNGPVIPIYGFGAIFIIILLQRNHINYPYFSLMIESGVLACVLEYITSYVMEKLFHKRWWDYTKRPFNVNGRICLEGFICFGIFGTVVIKWIQPFLDRKIAVYNETLLLILCTVMLTLFVADICSTIIGLAKLDERIIELQEILETEGDKYFLQFQKYHNELIKNSLVIKRILEEKESNSEHINLMKKHSKYVEKRLLKAFPFIINKNKEDIEDEH